MNFITFPELFSIVCEAWLCGCIELTLFFSKYFLYNYLV